MEALKKINVGEREEEHSCFYSNPDQFNPVWSETVFNVTNQVQKQEPQTSFCYNKTDLSSQAELIYILILITLQRESLQDSQ